jgi:hypothetical protein
LEIDDAQFNLLFSFRAMISMFIPFLVPVFLDRYGLQYTSLTISGCCMLGQWMFIEGLKNKNYTQCLLSRLIFGVSDSMTIVQQTIMCMWFNQQQLPIAFGMLLFLVKMVRAINDNVASIIYNYYNDL